MSKAKTLVIFFICLLIISSLFCFNVSASLVSGINTLEGWEVDYVLLYEGTLSQPETSVQITSSEGSSAGDGLTRITITAEEIMKAGNYSFKIYVIPPDGYITDKNYVLGRYDIWLSRVEGFEFINKEESITYRQDTGAYGGSGTMLREYGEVIQYIRDDGFPVVRSIYNSQEAPVPFDSYVVEFNFYNPGEVKVFNIYIALTEFEIVSPSKYETDKIIQNQDENTDKIISNQDDNTDKLIEAEKELQENEKNEAQSSGNGGVDDVTQAIPNHSESLMSAFTNLVKQMTHEKTDCGFNSPAIEIPKIGDFIPKKIVLMNPQWIALDSYCNSLIPKNLLNLIRALLSAALVIYCFKELYATFEYVMTLKGGKDDE